MSFAATRVESSIPLWVLFLAVQFLDVLWAPLVLTGIEKVRIAPGTTASNPLAFGALFAGRRQLWIVMIAHAAFNLTAIAVIYQNREARLAQPIFH